MTDHEKQFTYLPLDILKSATNIGELVLPTVAKGQIEWLDFAIGEIHKQMPTKCGRWLKELANLRFIESIEDDESNHDASNANENVITEKPAQKVTHTEPEPEPEPEPSTSTAMPKGKKNVSKTSKPNEAPKQLRSRKVIIKFPWKKNTI